jgi:hypothetical protein
LVSVSKNKKDEFEKVLHSSIQSFNLIGRIGGASLKINNDINVSLDVVADLYFNTIPRIMTGEK